MSHSRKTAARSNTPTEKTNCRQGVPELLMNPFLTTALRNDDPFYHRHSAAVRCTAKTAFVHVAPCEMRVDQVDLETYGAGTQASST